MQIPAPSTPWQPLTFGGVAAFAHGSFGRLLKVQSFVAALVTASMVWFFITAWYPEIDRAIGRLPNNARIRNATLEWTGPAPVCLVEGPFLSVTVAPARSTDLGGTADVRLVLQRDRFDLGSWLGHWTLPYPRGWLISLDRGEAEAWWGAWQTPLLFVAGAGAFVLLICGWDLVAALYAVLLVGSAVYADRTGGWRPAWRLAAAALLPGAVLMSGAVLLYSVHRLDLIGLTFAWALHLVLGWVYVLVSPWFLPGKTRAGNPFQPGTPPRRRRSKGNPFAGR